MRQLKITKSITNRESASLDKYLQEIGREELVSPEEEVELSACRKISNKHFSLAVAGIGQMEKFIDSPTRKIVCINDVKIPDSKYQSYRSRLLAAFERRFPDLCRFEL